jgi:phosphonoacetaldehyde hydrolase
VPAKIKLVIFDWAGTTVDFGSCAPAFSFLQAFAEFGVDVTLAEARAPMGLHKKDHLREMLKAEPLAAKWQLARGTAWTEADIDALYARVTPLQTAAAAERGTLCPGVRECVTELRRRGVRIGATTGYFRAAAEAVYAAGAAQGYTPDAMCCADDVSAGRPAPWMIYRILEATNSYPPTTVVKVGDTLIDIHDGVNAGVWSVGVVDSSNLMGLTLEEFAALSDEEKDACRATIREQYFDAGADGVIDTLDELPGLIDELEKLLEDREEN